MTKESLEDYWVVAYGHSTARGDDDMKRTLFILAMLASMALWAREAIVDTTDGRTYTGQVRFDSKGILIANATQDFRVSIPLNNLLGARFPAQTPFLPVKLATSEKMRATETSAFALPGPWKEQDVGNFEVAGRSKCFSGVFQIENAGVAIGGPSDSFHFIYKAVRGDSEIVTRLLYVRYSAPWAKAGLMMRENLDGNSPNVFLAVQARAGGVLQSREQPGADTTEVWLRELGAPYWLKLKREGNTFTAYTSRGGRQWRIVQRIDLPMNDEIYVGVAAAGVMPAPPTPTSLQPGALRRRSISCQASLDNLMEGPFLPSWFVPRIELQNGSRTVGRIAWADEKTIHFEGESLGPEPIPVNSVASILFQWVPTRAQKYLAEGRAGVVLSNGDFFEGEFRGLEGNRLKISSVLMGLKSFDINYELLALVLRRPQVWTPVYEVETEDGSTWLGQGLQIENGDLVIEQALVGIRKVPVYELRSIRRLTTPARGLGVGNAGDLQLDLANVASGE